MSADQAENRAQELPTVEFEYEIIDEKLNLYRRAKQKDHNREIPRFLYSVVSVDFQLGRDNLREAIARYALEHSIPSSGLEFTARSLKEQRVVHRGLLELDHQQVLPENKIRIRFYN